MTHENLFNVAVKDPIIMGTGLIALDMMVNCDKNMSPRLWAGGTCGNVLTILSYLGWQAYPISRLNGDIASEHIVQDLRKWGVHLNFVNSKPVCSTPIIIHKIVHKADGRVYHRFSWRCPNCGNWLPSYRAATATIAKDLATQIGKPKVFFFDRVSRGALILAKASSERGAVVVFEPSGNGDKRLFKEALALANILKYSNERVEQLKKMGLIGTDAHLLEIETFGPDGLRYRSRIPSCETNGWKRLNAYKVTELKDAAGAGDWCTAGIIHLLGQKGIEGFKSITNTTLLGALRFGQALAAWNCSFEGARGGMYTVDKKTFRSEIIKIIYKNKAKIPVYKGSNSGIKGEFSLICPSCSDGRQYKST